MLYPWGHQSRGNQSAALVLLHGGDIDRVQEEPGRALPAGTWRDMVTHSATPSQHSQQPCSEHPQQTGMLKAVVG